MSTVHTVTGGKALLEREKFEVARDSREPPEALVRAAQRVTDARAELATARRELRSEVRKASAAGFSLSAIGRVVGITRQRVKILRDEEEEG